MVIVLALAFLMSAVITIYLLFRIGDTRVPNLVGKPEIEAQKTAEKAGFKIKIQRRPDPSVPANTVIETRPVPNSSVKRDSVLTLVVSNGPPQLKSELGARPIPPAVFSVSSSRVLGSPGRVVASKSRSEVK
jgi:serine/threonine-protein kinase